MVTQYNHYLIYKVLLEHHIVVHIQLHTYITLSMCFQHLMLTIFKNC